MLTVLADEDINHANSTNGLRWKCSILLICFVVSGGKTTCTKYSSSRFYELYVMNTYDDFEIKSNTYDDFI